MPFERIVVGTDGSANADAALRVATEIGGPDATVHVVTAFEPPSDSDIGRFIASLPAEIRDRHDPTARSQQVLRDASAFVKAAGVPFVDHLVDAEPASAILDVAEKVGADLIVVGCRGLSESDRFRRGSVSNRVTSWAKRSVLVVHA